MSSRKLFVLVAAEHAEAIAALIGSLPGNPEVRVVSSASALLDLPRDRRIDVLFLDADLLEEGEIPWLRRVWEARVPHSTGIVGFSGRGVAAARSLQALGFRPLWKPYVLAELYASAQEALFAMERPARERAESFSIPELARGLADEINNPLASVSGYLQLLSLDFGKNPSEEITEKLSAIRESLSRIGATVEQLALASGSRRAKTTAGDLAQFAREFVKSWKSRGKSSFSFRTQELPNALPVSMDEKLLSQAAGQMALFFSAAFEGKVDVRLRGESDESGQAKLIWSVSPNPIPTESLATIFEPYSLARQGIAAGLSLAAVRGALRAHGGEALALPGENGSLEIHWILPA